MDAPIPKLSTREREVMHHVAEGLRNREIARRMMLSESTVKNYLSRAMSKLGATNRTQAALITLRSGEAPGT